MFIITKNNQTLGHCKGHGRQKREQKTTATVTGDSLLLLRKSQKQKWNHWITGYYAIDRNENYLAILLMQCTQTSVL